ncbi:hypothetical protein L1049_004149 [Liquidambar formosana]|uniref:Uncharacterized protein n=1 Tax=Liquidambar formosana TaxID=63359 RepID=A0AAP0RNK7_LIQFO
MERQRSFSFKPTRCLVFSFAISSSVLFLAVFSIWVIKATPSLRQETHPQFRKPSLNVGPKPIILQNLTGFNRNSSASGVKNPISVPTHFRRPEDASGSADISVLKGPQRKENKSEVSADKGKEGDAVNGNFTTWQKNVSETSSENLEVSRKERIKEKRVKEL